MDIKSEILQGKAIVLRHGPLNDVYNTLGPQGKAVRQADGSVVVQWINDAMKVLRNLGYEGAYAPSTISYKYNWPGMYKPMAHQKVTADFLTMNQRAYVFSEQGTGKTMAAIWASHFLLTKKKIRRVLILSPLSVMKTAWFDDLTSIVIDMQIGLAIGDRKRKQKVIESDAKYVIMPYDSVPSLQKVIARSGFDLIIADESTYLKNPKADRSRAVQALVAPHVWVWAMTGTPVAQSPMDAHGQYVLMQKTGKPMSMTEFRAKVMEKMPYSDYGWTPRPEATQIVYDMLQPAIRFTKDECLDLPERTYQTREIAMGVEQKKQYTKLKKEGILRLNEGVVTAVNAGVMMTKLLQVASGTVYSTDGEVVAFDNDARLSEMKSIIDGAVNKVLVFCTFKHSASQVCQYLTANGISWDIISGAKTGNARAESITRFQKEKDPKVMVIQPKAASHGITLTAADTVIWFNPILSVDTYLQANDRIHRNGQKNACTVYHLVASPIERQIYNMLQTRVESQDSLLSMYRQALMEDA